MTYSLSPYGMYILVALTPPALLVLDCWINIIYYLLLELLNYFFLNT